MNNFCKYLGSFLIGLSLTTGTFTPAFAETRLLNVSYDPTREFYEDYNKAFAAHWKSDGGDDITIQQSHEIGRAHV